MRKMKITYHEIVSEIDNLGRELKRHGNEALSHRDKITVSDLLAETVQMIRRKYELTTMYYLASEIKAANNVGPAARDDSTEATWKWSGEMDVGYYYCSACQNVNTFESPFCPVCGRRMREDHV